MNKNKKPKFNSSPLMSLILGFTLLGTTQTSLAKDTIQTSVVSQDKTHVTQYEGSKFFTYFMGESVGASEVITGVAVIEPNNEVHPAHQHPEEEYLMVIEGSGLWTVNEDKFPAKAGDILYAAPNDLHGIFNSGDTPLKFVVFKWLSEKPSKKVVPKDTLDVAEKK